MYLAFIYNSTFEEPHSGAKYIIRYLYVWTLSWCFIAIISCFALRCFVVYRCTIGSSFMRCLYRKLLSLQVHLHTCSWGLPYVSQNNCNIKVLWVENLEDSSLKQITRFYGQNIACWEIYFSAQENLAGLRQTKYSIKLLWFEKISYTQELDVLPGSEFLLSQWRQQLYPPNFL